MESGEPEPARPKRETEIAIIISKNDVKKANRFVYLPRGDCIRLDVPRRRFVDGELLADECELST